MKIAGLVFGILAICGMIFGFIPCLGAFNWVNIPFAAIGVIISGLGYSQDDGQPKNNAIAGLIMCSIAVIFGLFRLILGGGVI